MGICIILFSASINFDFFSLFDFFYDAGAIVYYNSEHGDGNGPILYSDVSCIGYEDGIYDCEKDSYDDISSCSRTNLIGLLCSDGNTRK